MRARTAALSLTAVLLLSACGGTTEPTTARQGAGTETTTPSDDLPPASEAENEVPTTIAADVWFLAGDDPAGPFLTAFTREVQDHELALHDALAALLAGPDATEDASTAIPPGTRLLSVEVRDGVAVVDLSQEFASGGGSFSMRARVGQIIYTATGFEGVEQVRLAIEHEEVETLGGEGLLLDEPQGRDAFADLTGAFEPGAEVPTDNEPSGQADCAAADLATVQVAPQGVPDATARTLMELVSAAQSCDYQRLAEIALGGDGVFTASFGRGFDSAADLAAYWADLEADHSEPITAIVVKLAGLPTYSTVATRPDGTDVDIHVSPRAQSDDATAADDQAVLDAFGETARNWWADGMYLGWRMGVTADGDWQFLVAGD